MHKVCRLTLVLFAGLLAACGGGSGGSPSSAIPGTLSAGITFSPTQATWIVSENGIGILAQAMPLAGLQALFNRGNTFEIMDMQNKPDPLPAARHILYYRDETLIAPDIASGKFANIAGALYDDEAYAAPGNTTPPDQIANPLPYVQNAQQVLHGVSKVFLYTIGPNVGPQGQFWSTTLPSIAPYPDFTDFQTQNAQLNGTFARQVAHYAQTYLGSGGHGMLVGIGSTTNGLVTEPQIASAYTAALTNAPPANGFWLNMAVQSPSCPNCPQQINTPPIAQFLQALP